MAVFYDSVLPIHFPYSYCPLAVYAYKIWDKGTNGVTDTQVGSTCSRKNMKMFLLTNVSWKKTGAFRDTATAERPQLTAINTQCFCYGNISEGQALRRQSKSSTKVCLRMSLCVWTLAPPGSKSDHNVMDWFGLHQGWTNFLAGSISNHKYRYFLSKVGR